MDISKEDLEKGIKLKVDKESITIDERFFEIEKILPKGYEYEKFSKGFVIINTEIDEELLSYAFAREIVRRIQHMRKELNLNVEDFIEARVEVKKEKLTELIKKHINYISRETRAKRLMIDTTIIHEGYIKEWDINGESFKISIKKI